MKNRNKRKREREREREKDAIGRDQTDLFALLIEFSDVRKVAKKEEKATLTYFISIFHFLILIRSSVHSIDRSNDRL